MNEIKEVFFAPSVDWFKKKAKELRLHIGCDVIKHYASLDLLARVHGFVSWYDFLEYQGGSHEHVTFWDSELDEKAFEERRYMQVSALMGALRIGEAAAVEILNEVVVSGRRAAMSVPTERDEILEFSSKLQMMLDEHREAALATGARPVVTYKKRHVIVHDVVPPRLH